MEEKVLIEEKDLIEIKQSSQDVELFKDYEVNKFRITPSLYKIVIASFLINTVFGFSLSQMDLFQQKACDSAYIGKVCQVLDAAYVGSKFFGTTRTTVDEPYEKTEFDTADITWVDVSNKELFQYPEGYFFKEEPVQEPLAGNEFAMVNGGDGKSTNPGAFLPPGANPFTTTPSNPTTTIPNNPTTTTPPSTKLDIKKPPVLPKQNNQMKPSDFDGLSIVNTVNSGEKTSTPKKKDEPKKTPNDNNTAGVDPKDKQPTSDKTAGKKQIDPKNSQLEIKNFNKKPLEDYRVRAKEILKAGIDSNAVFAVTMKGVLTKDGKLDSSLSNWGNDTVGDPKLVDLVKDGITALNDSGYFEYLSRLNAKELYFSAVQKDGSVSAKVIASVGSESEAKKISSGFRVLISLGISSKKEDIEEEAKKGEEAKEKMQNGIDELFLLQKATVTSQGNKIVISFDMPSDVAKEFIERKMNQGQNNSATAKPQSSNLNINQASAVEKSK